MQNNTLIFYTDSFRYHVHLVEGKDSLVGQDESAQVYVEGLGTTVRLRLEDNQVFYQHEDQAGLSRTA